MNTHRGSGQPDPRFLQEENAVLIAGFQKTSFVDFPGQPAAVVFTPYCNFNCGYCHNAHILKNDAPLLAESIVWDYLEKRRGILKAVVISGGEPTLQQNLTAFIRRVKEMGYLVKLDTNGAKPETVKALVRDELIDYIAMDIKAPLEKYDAITRVHVDTDAVRRSILFLRNGNVPHEFRTTFCPELTPDDALEAAKLVKGTEKYFLQQYRKRFADDPEPHLPSVVNETAERIREAIGVCTVRGL